ncbi:leucine-rich repeat protein 1-like isoform X5 [Linepithema humile]
MMLDLSHNYLGKSAESSWMWLEQTPIRNTLLRLNICHNFLTKLPLQIICLKNITNLSLSNNEIVCLPIEFGTLPLTMLDLSHNYLGKFAELSWMWLEQTRIRNTLLSLNICHNFLTELPLQIGKLNILSSLLCDQNMLKHLPQNFVNLQFLKVLTLSKNLFSYLPGTIVHLNLSYLNVEDNPFVSNNTLLHVVNISHGWKVLSLSECSARLILNSRINYNAIPNVLIRYLDEANYCCICGTACFHYDLQLFVDYFLYDMLWPLKFIVTKNYYKAMFECYICSLRCTRLLRTIWNPYIETNFCNDNDHKEKETENKKENDDNDENDNDESEDDNNEEEKQHEYKVDNIEEIRENDGDNKNNNNNDDDDDNDDN